MANIDKYLYEISHAVYGKEVRKAIHDGLKAINDEGTNGEGSAVPVGLHGQSIGSTPRQFTPVKPVYKIDQVEIDAELQDGFSTCGFVIDRGAYPSGTNLTITGDLNVTSAGATKVSVWSYKNDTGIDRDGKCEGTLIQSPAVEYSAKSYTFTLPDTDEGRYQSFMFKVEGIKAPEHLKLTFKNVVIAIDGQTVDVILEGSVKSTFCGKVHKIKISKTPLFKSPKLNSRWNGRKYIAIGDGLTDENNNKPNPYPTLVSEILNCRLTNYGSSGMTMSTINTDNSLVTKMYNYGYEADIISVMIGVNDFMRGTPIGEVSLNNKDVSTFVGAYNTFLQHVIANCNGMIVLLEPIFYGAELKNNSAGIGFDEYRDAIKFLAKKYDLPYTRINAKISQLTTKEYQDEASLHFLEKTRFIFAESLASYLASL